MINWSDPKMVWMFQSGLLWAMTCRRAQLEEAFAPWRLLARGQNEVHRYTRAQVGSGAYREALTAWLEGAWAYIIHPFEGEVRLAALSGQIAFHQCRLRGLPTEWTGLPQKAADLYTPEEQGAYRQGFQAAAAGKQEEVLDRYNSRPPGYNDLLAKVASSEDTE